MQEIKNIRTAIHAFIYLDGGKKINKGWLLVARVLAFDLPKSIQSAGLYPNSVGFYLRQNAEVIDAMFAKSKYVVDKSFEENFKNALDVWNAYLTTV